MIDRGANLALRMMADQERRDREYRLREMEERIELDRQRDAIRRRDAERERLTREAAGRRARIAAYDAKYGDPRLRVRKSAALRPATRAIAPPADMAFRAFAGGLEFVGRTQAEADARAAAWRAQIDGREVIRRRRDHSALADGHEDLRRR